MRTDLESRVEQSKKKLTQGYVDNLKALDSNLATTLIKSRLDTSNVKPERLLAGILFMMESYGSLYLKKLHPYKGTFAWYRALGGSNKPPDALYKEVLEETKLGDPIALTEEMLIHRKLKAL